MKRTMYMIIASPEGILFEGNVESVKFPGALGTFMVLPKHASIISALINGKLTYSLCGNTSEITIQSGFVEVNKDAISVCVEIQ